MSNSSWESTRLIVRWGGDYSPGLASALGVGIPIEVGALIMQPERLKGMSARADAAGSACLFKFSVRVK